MPLSAILKARVYLFVCLIILAVAVSTVLGGHDWQRIFQISIAFADWVSLASGIGSQRVTFIRHSTALIACSAICALSVEKSLTNVQKISYVSHLTQNEDRP